MNTLNSLTPYKLVIPFGTKADPNPPAESSQPDFFKEGTFQAARQDGTFGDLPYNLPETGLRGRYTKTVPDLSKPLSLSTRRKRALKVGMQSALGAAAFFLPALAGGGFALAAGSTGLGIGLMATVPAAGLGFGLAAAKEEFAKQFEQKEVHADGMLINHNQNYAFQMDGGTGKPVFVERPEYVSFGGD